MSKFHGRLEIDLVEKYGGKEHHIFEIKENQTIPDCWYLDSLGEDLKGKVLETFLEQSGSAKIEEMAPG